MNITQRHMESCARGRGEELPPWQRDQSVAELAWFPIDDLMRGRWVPNSICTPIHADQHRNYRLGIQDCLERQLLLE